MTDVLINNEEVTAQITGWISGSICEKYGTECAVLGIGMTVFPLLRPNFFSLRPSFNLLRSDFVYVTI